VLKVLAAVVRVYGLDPSWLLTGQYDRATHRIALQQDAAGIERVLNDLFVSNPARKTAKRNYLAADQPRAPGSGFGPTLTAQSASRMRAISSRVSVEGAMSRFARSRRSNSW
jgi:hypothetical protein